jgi:hypothetical protein
VAINTRNRSDFLPGLCLLILAAFVLLGTGLYAHFRTNPRDRGHYIIEFSLGMGIQGLETGSPIRIGGLDVGQVDGLRYEQGRLMVEIELDNDVRLYPGTQIVRVGSLMGGQAMLVITDAGGTKSPPLKRGATIQAAPGAGGVENLIGRKNASRLDQIQTSIISTVSGLEAIGDQAGTISDNAESLRELAGMMKADAETWRPKVEKIEDRFESIRVKSARIKGDVEETSEQLEGASWEKLKKTLNELLARKEETEKEFDKSVLPKIDKLLSSADAGWDNLLASKDSFEKLAGEGRTSLEIFMANSTLAGEQLRLAESEILGALGIPLLQKPSIEDQQLLIQQEAMGDWARAAFTLRASLVALETISIREGDDAQATLARLIDALHAALADYEEMQARFLAHSDPTKPQK